MQTYHRYIRYVSYTLTQSPKSPLISIPSRIISIHFFLYVFCRFFLLIFSAFNVSVVVVIAVAVIIAIDLSCLLAQIQQFAVFLLRTFRVLSEVFFLKAYF